MNPKRQFDWMRTHSVMQRQQQQGKRRASASPQSAPIGTTISFTVVGFEPRIMVEIEIIDGKGKCVGTAQTNADEQGDIGEVTLDTEKLAAGEYKFVATSKTESVTSFVSTRFKLTPREPDEDDSTDLMKAPDTSIDAI